MNGSGMDEGEEENNDFLVNVKIEELIHRCENLLTELRLYETFLKQNTSASRPHDVELKGIRNPIHSERDTLNALSSKDAPQKHHAVASSNLPFYEAVWSTAKCHRGVVGFRRRFDCMNDNTSAQKPSRRGRSAMVDVIADGGAHWIRVSTITEKRLLFEIAKQGWDVESDSEQERGDHGWGVSHVDDGDHDEDEISIVRIADELVKASRTHRFRYRHPTFELVLPNICPGRVPQIDTVLRRVQAKCEVRFGIHKSLDPPNHHLGSTSPQASQSDSRSETHDIQEQKHQSEFAFSSNSNGSINSPRTYHHKTNLTTTFQTMKPDSFTNISTTLNIDCTILLALVSDLSHMASLTPQPWFNDFIRRQIETEATEKLLDNHIYPIMRGRKLICVKEAADRMREIVRDIGTEPEKQRTAILMGDGQASAAETRVALARFSDYAVPSDLQIPISVTEGESESNRALPRVSEKIGQELSDINRSVFLTGWGLGCTTVTSNRLAVKQIEGMMQPLQLTEWLRSHPEAHRVRSGELGYDEDEFIGPDVWLCTTFRSLIGKDRGRKGK